jgi:hypothetical protein
LRWARRLIAPNLGGRTHPRGILRSSNLMKRVQQLRDVAAVLRDLARESEPLAPGVSELAGECEALAGSIERLLSEETARAIRRSE